MTKPVTRKMAVDCLLWLAELHTDSGYELGVCGVVFRCPECSAPILAGQDIQFDHRHADIHGGPHEFRNIRPLHAQCHKAKTKRDVQANAKVKRIAKGGRKRKGPKMKSRPFPKKKAA